MRSIEYSDFINLPLNTMVDGECLEVNLDGVMQFYTLIKPEGGMVATVDGVCSQIDNSRGVIDQASPAATSQEELDAILVEGRAADPDPIELATARERVQARTEAADAKVAKELAKAQAITKKAEMAPMTPKAKS
jgi:hypothetical protein